MYKDKLTIVMATHFIPSAPDTRIIEETIRGMETMPELDGCRCIIGYDMPAEQNQQHRAYYNNLKNIKCKYPIEVFIKINAQQRMNFMNVIRRVTTKYFLFMENDWLFIEPPNWNSLFNVMDNHEEVSTVYFNKRPNIIHKNEQYLIPVVIEDLPLLKTSKWSNNPYLARTSKWFDEWLPALLKAPLDRREPLVQIENILHYKYLAEIATEGFEQVHSRWGMYSYGELNKNKMVLHLDGSESGKS